MNDLIKKQLKEKLEINPSADFDKAFFQKLETHKKAEARAPWWKFYVFGVTFASLAIVAISIGPQTRFFGKTQESSLTHFLEYQEYINQEVLNDDSLSLTSPFSDEI